MKDDVNDELSAGRQALQAAQRLLKDELPRDAASRAYYAMFHAASALLMAEDKRMSSHKETIAAFGKEFAKPLRIDSKFHRYLIEAQDLRELADYGTHTPIASEKVATTIDRAAEFLKMSEAFLKSKG
jgi:uncharacterized protein